MLPAILRVFGWGKVSWNKHQHIPTTRSDRVIGQMPIVAIVVIVPLKIYRDRASVENRVMISGYFK